MSFQSQSNQSYPPPQQQLTQLSPRSPYVAQSAPSSNKTWIIILSIIGVILLVIVIVLVVLYVTKKCPSATSCPSSTICPSCGSCGSSSSPCPKCSVCPSLPSSSSSPSPSLAPALSTLETYYTQSGCPTTSYIPWGSYLSSVALAVYDPIANNLSAVDGTGHYMSLDMSTCAAGSAVNYGSGPSLTCTTGSGWLPFCSTSAPNAQTAPVNGSATGGANVGGTTMVPGGSWLASCQEGPFGITNNIMTTGCNVSGTMTMPVPIDQCPFMGNVSAPNFTCT